MKKICLYAAFRVKKLFFMWPAGFRRWRHWGQQQWWRGGLWRGSNTHLFLHFVFNSDCAAGCCKYQLLVHRVRKRRRKKKKRMTSCLSCFRWWWDGQQKRHTSQVQSWILDWRRWIIAPVADCNATFYGGHVGWKVAITNNQGWITKCPRTPGTTKAPGCVLCGN